MLHVFIGTKAQYVKMAPVLLELDRRGVAYNLIDSGQHSSLSSKYRKFFNIKEPDCFLTKSDNDITTIFGAIKWSSKIFFDILFQPKKICHDIFKGEKGLCLVHGDTPTTLLSLLAAKRAGIKVAHLESGLRSYNIFHPFPEEIIRIFTMKMSDYLFAPSQWAFDNLNKMKLIDKSFLVCGNTNIDALKFVEEGNECDSTELELSDKYVIFSIHRVETLVNRNRLKEVVDLAILIAESKQVLFCLHPPTKKKLLQSGLYSELENTKNIVLNDLLAYPKFIQCIQNSKFIVTDGGSVQEESFFLNIPCLLMRHRTERMEGIGTNVCLSKFDKQIISHFLDNYDQYRNKEKFSTNLSPSSHIVDIVLEKT